MGTLRCVICFLVLLVLFSARPSVGADDAELQLEAAARRFRIISYDRFRSNRRELDRRLQASQSVLDGWRRQGAQPDQVPALIQWFRQTARGQLVPLEVDAHRPDRRPVPTQAAERVVPSVPTSPAPSETPGQMCPRRGSYGVSPPADRCAPAAAGTLRPYAGRLSE